METCNQLRIVKKGECLYCGCYCGSLTWMCEDHWGDHSHRNTISREIMEACSRNDHMSVTSLRKSVEGMTVEEMRIVLAMVATR